MSYQKFLVMGLMVTAVSIAYGDGGSAANKPIGFRFFNQHLTIKPYVSLTYTYDSNVDSAKDDQDDNLFAVQPGVDFSWKADRWEIVGSVFYRYDYYCDNSDNMDESSYGEKIAYKWSSSDAGTRGWSLMLSESYTEMSQSDELTDGGRGVWRDRHRFDIAGALEYRFSERWHADVSGQYDWLEYDNDEDDFAPLYGYEEASAGFEAGYVLTKWTDILLSIGYSFYKQDDAGSATSYVGSKPDDDSSSLSIMGGIGTHATERITYRALVGISQLYYDGGEEDTGWTYSLSANWRVTRQVQLSLLGSSYYQPSERSYGSADKVYSLSGGVSYLTLGDRVNLTANIAYRHEMQAHTAKGQDEFDYDSDFVSMRLGANYTINRWISVFANASWEDEWNENHDDYDYDRYRLTLGTRFHY